MSHWTQDLSPVEFRDALAEGNLWKIFFNCYRERILFLTWCYEQDDQACADLYELVIDHLMVQIQNRNWNPNQDELERWICREAHRYCFRQGRAVRHIPPHSSRSEDEYEALNDCLNQLSDNQRRAIILFFWEDFSEKEIANICAVASTNTVSAWLRRGKLKLASCLKEKYPQLILGMEN